MFGFESPGAQACHLGMIASAQMGSTLPLDEPLSATPVALTAVVRAGVPPLILLAALPWYFAPQL